MNTENSELEELLCALRRALIGSFSPKPIRAFRVVRSAVRQRVHKTEFG
ncbi:MAG: hypothetical protein NT077_03270 [Candidatus Taylorbacteria bacterium]|nr:hypothetical protein [Candidatus Taylorbacteria bacterium]